MEGEGWKSWPAAATSKSDRVASHTGCVLWHKIVDSLVNAAQRQPDSHGRLQPTL